MKGRVLKAIEQQNQLGLILTLRGFLASKGWKSAVYHSEEDRQPRTEAQRNSWATTAIHQFWKVIIGAWKDRNEVLHHGKNNTISQSEHDEKIKWH